MRTYLNGSQYQRLKLRPLLANSGGGRVLGLTLFSHQYTTDIFVTAASYDMQVETPNDRKTFSLI